APGGQDSKPPLGPAMADVRTKVAGLGPVDTSGKSRTYERRRRPWGQTAKAVSAVLVDSGPMRACDIHAAVQAALNDPISRSSVKNYLAAGASGSYPIF